MLDGDPGLAEGVKHLGFAEARGVELEGEAAGGIVDVETAEAVNVGEFAETLKLLVAEGRKEFVADFQECHGGDYSSDDCQQGKAKIENGKLKIARNAAAEDESRRRLTPYRDGGYR